MRSTPNERMQPERLRQAWADLLRGIAWSYFVTLTFQRSPGRYGALSAAREWVRIVAAGGATAVFLAVERGGHGLWHAHLLVATPATLGRKQVERQWRRGIAEVDPYDPLRGAAYYVAKFTFDEDAEYDLEIFGEPNRLDE
ncbi:MAG: hypothetical protein OXU33_14080 [Gemmatimonadota bacterium]|nr:hypothetical protein [Gemmatimonadota bacterium]MDE3006329.1 hypothetical protein [Gemmatimonadota bacterium]MDE3015190.1 hypothetical protein [Gemmatimonadota bacterium]